VRAGFFNARKTAGNSAVQFLLFGLQQKITDAFVSPEIKA
jgi:hypothetical protein